MNSPHLSWCNEEYYRTTTKNNETIWDIRAQYHIELRLSFLKNDVYIVKKKICLLL